MADGKPETEDKSHETLFTFGDGQKVSGPKGSKKMVKIIVAIVTALLAAGGGGFGIKEYVQAVEKREADRAQFEDDRYNKLANVLENVLHAVNELKTEVRIGAVQKAETERRFATIEAELKVQSALWAAMGDKYVRREDFERNQRELQRALQDIAELKARLPK
jgi:hypothetical protein